MSTTSGQIQIQIVQNEHPNFHSFFGILIWRMCVKSMGSHSTRNCVTCIAQSPKESVTKIDELDHQQEYDFSYLDETKNKRKCVIVMIDHTAKKNIGKSQSRCFWCRNPFEYRTDRMSYQVRATCPSQALLFAHYQGLLQHQGGTDTETVRSNDVIG